MEQQQRVYNSYGILVGNIRHIVLRHDKGSNEMNEKYELTNHTIVINGHTLHRIRALKDFGDVKAGDLGGYVGGISNLCRRGHCWVYDDAAVYGCAQVTEDGKIKNNARAYDYGRISGQATVSMNARICGRASIAGCATIQDDAVINGRAKISGKTTIGGSATVTDAAEVYGTSFISGSTRIYGKARVYGAVRLSGGSSVGGTAVVRQDGTLVNYHANGNEHKWKT